MVTRCLSRGALALLVSVTACRSSAKGSSTDGAAPQGEPREATPASLPISPSAQASVPTAVAEPLVDLSGSVHAPAPPAEGSPRLASSAMLTPVLDKPRASGTRVGFLRAGAIVAVDPAPVEGTDCSGGWRAIKPYGYVCLGSEATTSLDDPIVRASARRPDFTQALPYMYGISTRGGPVYAKLPTAKEQEEFEPSLAKHLAKWRKDKTSGATYGLDVWLKWRGEGSAPAALEALEDKITEPNLPWFLRDGARVPNLSRQVKTADAVKIDTVSRRTGLAFVDSFLYEGRRMNVTTDLRVIPADRFRPIRGSTFHGWRIGNEVELPAALVRRPGGKKWKISGKKLVDDGELEWRTAIELTGKQQFFNGRLHYEAKAGFWVDDLHAGRVDPAKRMPAWGKNGEKWIDINVTKQVLVAYEGTVPVYMTLVSTGEAGLGDHETTKSSKRGIFRIHTKHVSITMDSDVVGEEFELRDVPYVQYYEGGYALHSAYWHDRFGRPKSHGCINLAPEDARRLFFWTEPPLPPGWHGVARPLTGTVLFIHA
jgi:hypothetical protein